MDDKSASFVNLIVKASNQQYDDQTVKCECNWTIKKLKEHLAEAYPCKPAISEQKLIYSGKLLKDDEILRDLLRNYEDTVDIEPKHIFHLVYAPKYQKVNVPRPAKPVPSPNATDGLRQRNVQRTPAEVSQTINSNLASNFIPQMMAAAAASSGVHCPVNNPAGIGVATNAATGVPPFGLVPQSSNEYMLAQQMALQNWMQQVYVQYMNQYMNLSSLGVRPDAAFTPTTSTHISGSFPHIPQNLPSFGNFGGHPSATPGPNATSMSRGGVPVISNVQQPQATVAPPAAAPAQEQPQPAAPAQPRFPNMVEEEQDNRDWLDRFYSLSRFMVLMTLVYFYSSPLRCLVVITIGLGIYLYHIGFFRNQRQLEANNNNINNNRNNARQPRPAENNPPNNGVGAAEQQPAENDAVDASVASVVSGADNNRPTVIAFVRTFVLSFFTSLLPDPPAL